MIDEVGSEWIVADIVGDDVHFALTKPETKPTLRGIKSYKTADFPTAVDCFEAYARDLEIDLFGRHCCVAVGGAITGDAIRVNRCRWTISIRGLTYIFGKKPHVVNDSTARGWSNLAFGPTTHRSVAVGGQPSFDRPGQWSSVNFATGVGAALLAADANATVTLHNSEVGFIGFTAETATERELALILSKAHPRVTWEIALTTGPSDPVWAQMGIIHSREIDVARAAMLGAFAGEVALALASWSGIFLHGNCAKILAAPHLIQVFNGRFEDKGYYKNNMRLMPRWLVEMTHVNLRGAAQCAARMNVATI